MHYVELLEMRAARRLPKLPLVWRLSSAPCSSRHAAGKAHLLSTRPRTCRRRCTATAPTAITRPISPAISRSRVSTPRRFKRSRSSGSTSFESSARGRCRRRTSLGRTPRPTTRSRGGSSRSLDATAKPNPGAPMLRRLNRAEYANAIRDLLDLRGGRRSAAAARRFGVRLRQHRRPAYLLADAARALPVRRRSCQRARRRRSDHGDRCADLHREGRRVAGGALGRIAAWHGRRRRGYARVPARRRIRARPDSGPEQPRHDSRARAPAPDRDRDRRQARIPCRRRRPLRGRPRGTLRSTSCRIRPKRG